MRKFFLVLSLISLIGTTYPCFADVVPIAGIAQHQANRPTKKKQPSPTIELPDPNDQEAVRQYFTKRLEEVARSQTAPGDFEDNTTSATSIIPPPEFYEKQKEAKKSIFERIYDETLKSLNKKDNLTENPEQAETTDSQNQNEITKSATRFFVRSEEQTPTAQEEKIPTVSVTLPSGRRILAPALEHIPYFLSYIDIQSNGYLKVEDTITVVANNQKFTHALTRVFPKYTYYLGKRGHRLEIILDSVTVNGTNVPYTIQENGNNLILKPKYNQQLEPGVYTYKFNYLINNKLQETEGLVFLDWNLTGQPINAFITSANIIITLPEGYPFRETQVIVGQGNNITNRRTNMFNMAKNVVAFSNYTPLLNGEEMTIIAVADRNLFIKDYNKNMSTFLIDWGNILYAGIGFFTILISFLLSLISLKKERKNKYTPSYSGSLMRNILIGKFDRIAFVAQLLELYRKKAIDIINDNNRLYLVATNIKNSRLLKHERKALKAMFNRKSSQLEINITNNQKLKKARNIFEKNTNKQIKKYRLMKNIGYLLFSIAMLLTTEFFIAAISINFAQSLAIMLSASMLFAFYIWIIFHKFKYMIVAIPLKIFSLLAVAVIWIFSSVYIGKITAILIIAMLIIIFKFSRIFGQYNNFVNDAKNAIGNYKEYLISSAEAINLSRDFVNQQSNIFALDIIEYYPLNVSNKNYYRLDIAENIKQKLIGIL